MPSAECYDLNFNTWDTDIIYNLFSDLNITITKEIISKKLNVKVNISKNKSFEPYNQWIHSDQINLKDIQDKLNTTKYNRFRFGISDAFSKGRQVDYVLGEWTSEESDKLNERLDKSIALIKSFGLAGVNNTMNTFNGK